VERLQSDRVRLGVRARKGRGFQSVKPAAIPGQKARVLLAKRCMHTATVKQSKQTLRASQYAFVQLAGQMEMRENGGIRPIRARSCPIWDTAKEPDYTNGTVGDEDIWGRFLNPHD
jgi:hypothetical protein